MRISIYGEKKHIVSKELKGPAVIGRYDKFCLQISFESAQVCIVADRLDYRKYNKELCALLSERLISFKELIH